MSEIENKTEDTSWEHSQHSKFDKNCSECFKEQKQEEDRERCEVCETCGGTGEVSCMEAVYPGEPHMAPIGTQPCPDCCGPDDYIDMSGADGSDDR